MSLLLLQAIDRAFIEAKIPNHKLLLGFITDNHCIGIWPADRIPNDEIPFLAIIRCQADKLRLITFADIWGGRQNGEPRRVQLRLGQATSVIIIQRAPTYSKTSLLQYACSSQNSPQITAILSTPGPPNETTYLCTRICRTISDTNGNRSAAWLCPSSAR